MKTSEHFDYVTPALAFGLIAGLLLLSNLGTAQVMMPRMHEMASMQDHRSHPQLRQTTPKPSVDEPLGSRFTFASVDVPNASGTLATGINSLGVIVGIYYDSAGNSHGFLLKKGSFTTVDVPGSIVGVSGTLPTEANGINGAGEIVGDYYAPPGAPGAPACTVTTPPFSPQCRRGFLYSNGRFSDVLVPGKAGSIPNAISPDGTIYGCDHNTDYFTSMVAFGRMGGNSYTLNAGGGELKNSKQQVLASMNNGATPDGSIIVGLYVAPPNSSGQNHGYVVQNGQFRQYDIAGSTATQIWGINSAASFVGLYDDPNGNEHGFLQNWGSSPPITIDVPSGPPFNATLTDSFAINSHGVIVGLYIDSLGNLHGYVAQ